MKVCPKCQATYGNELSFCLNDGTRLPARSTEGFSDAPTEAYTVATNAADDVSVPATVPFVPTPASAPPKRFQMSAMGPANRMGCVVTIGQISALILVVFGLGIGGFYYFTRSDSALVAYQKPAPPSSASNANVSAVPGDSAAYPLSTPPTGETSGSATRPGGVLNEKAVTLPAPAYPKAARAVKASGTVTVDVVVDERGRVISASAATGHPMLRAAAVAAAREAIFNPTLVAGKAVKVSGVLKFEFSPL